MSGAKSTISRICTGLALWVTTAPSTYAQSSTEFSESYDAMKADSRLQFEMPTPAPAPEQANWDWLETLMEFLGPIFEVLFYVGIACLVGMILYYLGREIIRTRFTRHKTTVDTTPEPAPLYAPGENEARILLEHIDALAAEGKFAEAVHTLLFRSIQDIDLSRPGTIRRSLTSREIAALDVLTPKSQTAFSTIAKIVENNFFGGRDLGRAEFDKCRSAYAALTAKATAA